MAERERRVLASVQYEEEHIGSECALHSFFHITKCSPLCIVALSWLSGPIVANAAFKVKCNWVTVSWRDCNDVICLLSSVTGKEICCGAVYEGCTDVG